jgi:hypothetical protein
MAMVKRLEMPVYAANGFTALVATIRKLTLSVAKSHRFFEIRKSTPCPFKRVEPRLSYWLDWLAPQSPVNLPQPTIASTSAIARYMTIPAMSPHRAAAARCAENSDCIASIAGAPARRDSSLSRTLSQTRQFTLLRL